MITAKQFLTPYITNGISRSITMKAVKYTPNNKTVCLVNKEIPCVSPSDVKIEVHYAGICRTDLRIIDGEFPCNSNGVVLGHEFCGIVEEVGKDVIHIKKGDRVVTDPNMGCMLCKNCRLGRPHYCVNGGYNSYIGIIHDGGCAEYAVIPHTQVYKVPDCLTLEQASLCEPMSCLSHTWDCASPVPLGSRILVLGSGIVGNLFASLLHLKGHKCVTISEPNENRLKFTRGLNLCYDLINPNCLRERQQADPNYLFDFVFDASGNAYAMEHAISLMDFGGKLCMFGANNPNATMKVYPFQMFQMELTLQGCLINPYSFSKSLSILETMGDRYITFKKLGIEIFRLDKFAEAIAALRNAAITKATFKIAQKLPC